MFALAQPIQRLQRRTGGEAGHAPLLHLAQQGTPIGSVVVDNQDALARQIWLLCGDILRRREFGLLRTDGEVERRTVARHARTLDPHLPSHQFGKSPADGKT